MPLFAKLLFLGLVLAFVKPSYSGEENVYDFAWLDPDKEVFVLQNRKFRKAGRMHLNAGAGITVSGPFVDAASFQGRAGFFFHEEWGFEVIYAKNSGKENDTAASVRNQGQAGAGSVPFRRIVDNYYGGSLLWSPFYAKVNTFNKIVYLDWILGLGIVPFNVSKDFLYRLALKYFLAKIYFNMGAPERESAELGNPSNCFGPTRETISSTTESISEALPLPLTKYSLTNGTALKYIPSATSSLATAGQALGFLLALTKIFHALSKPAKA